MVGSDMQRLKSSAAHLQKKLMDTFSRFAVRNDPMTFNEAGPERQVFIDQIRAKELGLSVDAISLAVRAMVDGAIVGDFSFEGDNIDMVIIRDPKIEVTPDALAHLPLAVTEEDGRSTMIPLGDVVHFVKADASQSIRRVERRRAVTFTVNPPSEMALEEAQTKIEELVAQSRREGGMSSDVQVNMAGNADKLSQVRTALLGHWTGWNLESIKSVGLSRFFLALLITYLLMAALFESFLYPMVIMLSVPLATVGGFVGLRLARLVDPSQQLDTLTMLGFHHPDRRGGQQRHPAGPPGLELHARHRRERAGRYRAAAAARGDPRIGQDTNPAHLHDHHHQRLRHGAPGARLGRRQRTLPRPGRCRGSAA